MFANGLSNGGGVKIFLQAMPRENYSLRRIKKERTLNFVRSFANISLRINRSDHTRFVWLGLLFCLGFILPPLPF